MASKGNKVKKIGIGISFVFIALFGLFVSITIFSPQVIQRILHKKEFYQAGLSIKKVCFGKEYLEYAEGGEGQTVVFVHGFQAQKGSWLSYIKQLLPKFHIIAIDLPGHGGSSLPKNQKFDLQSLAVLFAKFVDKIKLTNFHLVGSSTGGGICTIFAADHPEKLISLALINPLGVAFEKKSEFLKKVANGKNLFFPESMKDLDDFSYYLTGQPMQINKFVKKCMLSYLIKQRPFYQRAFSDLEKSKPLNDLLPKISTHTLVIFGDADKVLHPSSYKTYVDSIPNVEAYKVSDGTHVFIGKNLEKVVRNLDEFLSKNDTKIR